MYVCTLYNAFMKYGWIEGLKVQRFIEGYNSSEQFRYQPVLFIPW